MKKLWILFLMCMISVSVFAAEAAPAAEDTAAAVQDAAPKAPPTTQESVVAIYDKITTYLAENGIQLLLNVLAAIVIFLIGRWVAKLVSGLVKTAMDKSKIDPTLGKFVKNLLYSVLMVFVIIAALGRLGIQTGSFIAVIGAAGLAIGLALQGSLSNFAAGVLMIIFKPFKVGDFVEASGATGTIKEIQIFNTILNTPDNLRVIVPNSQVTGGNIINYTTNGTRRVDLVIGVSYGDDIAKAKDIMLGVMKADPLVLDSPAPFVGVLELADSSVNYVVRPWVKPEHYWDVYFGTTEKVKLALEAAGLTIPFPQRDVHLFNEAK